MFLTCKSVNVQCKINAMLFEEKEIVGETSIFKKKIGQRFKFVHSNGIFNTLIIIRVECEYFLFFSFLGGG